MITLIACLHHVYIGVILHARPIRVTHSTQRQLRGCNSI